MSRHPTTPTQEPIQNVIDADTSRTVPLPAARWTSGRAWALFTLAALAGLALLGIRRPYWGDEYHFVDTVRYFAQRPVLGTLRDYPELTPPLSFQLYRGWAMLFGDSVLALRLGSLALAALAWNVLYQVVRRVTGADRHALWLSLIVVANPYVLGTSFLVFTDMSALLFTLWAAWALLERRLWLYGASAAAALLCRQYAVVLPLAVLAAGLLEGRRANRLDLPPMLASLVSMLPLLSLFALWHGLAPPTGMRLWVIPNLAVFNIPAITAYVAFGTLYALPAVIWHLARRRWRVQDVAVLAIGLPWYLFMRIEPSAVTITQGRFHTVGLAHRAAVAVMGQGATSTVFFGIMFLAGLLVMKDLLAQLVSRRPRNGVPSFVALMWPVYLLVMPFSYQVWEKYLMQVLPFLVATVFALEERPDARTGTGST